MVHTTIVRCPSIALAACALLAGCDDIYHAGVGAPPGQTNQGASDKSGVVDVPAPPIAVTEYYNSPARSGVYVMPNLTRDRASGLTLDLDFDPDYTGNVEAQPLYLPDGPKGQGAYYVVTEANDVLAIAEVDGTILWKQSLGPPADRMNAACLGYNRLGITGTPYIDVASRTLYLDAIRAQGEAGARVIDTHLVHALSVDDGREREGWPVDLSAAVSAGPAFDPTTSGQRGALALVNGILFVPFGSIADCGTYHGSLVAVDVADPSKVTAWVASEPQAGLWSLSGVASDGDDVYVSTGNGAPYATSDEWGGAAALMRFPAASIEAAMPKDYFVPANWLDIGLNDRDINGVTLVALPDSTPSLLAIEWGKDGFLYGLDAKHLGGTIGTTPVILTQVATKNIQTSIASVPNDQGTMLVLNAETSGKGFGCPDGQSGNLVGVQVITGNPPTIRTAWCTPNYGYGAPIITTTDGTSEAIAWVYGAMGENRLRGYDALSGDLLYDGGGGDEDDDAVMTGLHRFSTLIAANGRLVIAADNGMYAFTF